MTTKRLVRISYFTMLTVIGGLLKLPVPFTPVFFSMQTLFVILSGFIIGKYDGAFCQIAYMIIGLVGIPIFTQGGGIGYVMKPSFGYIIGFPIGAFVAGFMMYRRKKINSGIIFFSGLLGFLPIYIIGMAYQVMILYFVSNITLIAALATLPAIIVMFGADLLMLFILCLIYPRLLTMIRQQQAKPIDNNNGTNAAADIKNLVIIDSLETKDIVETKQPEKIVKSNEKELSIKKLR